MSSRSTSDRHQQVKGGRKEEVRPPSFFHPLSFLCFPLPLSASLPPHSPSPLSLSLSLLHGDSDTAEILHLSHTLDESYASQTPSISQKFLFFLSSCFFFFLERQNQIKLGNFSAQMSESMGQAKVYFSKQADFDVPVTL